MPHGGILLCAQTGLHGACYSTTQNQPYLPPSIDAKANSLAYQHTTVAIALFDQPNFKGKVLVLPPGNGGGINDLASTSAGNWANKIRSLGFAPGADITRDSALVEVTDPLPDRLKIKRVQGAHPKDLKIEISPDRKAIRVIGDDVEANVLLPCCDFSESPNQGFIYLVNTCTHCVRPVINWFGYGPLEYQVDATSLVEIQVMGTGKIILERPCS